VVSAMCARLPLAVTTTSACVIFFLGKCYGACTRCRRFVVVEDLAFLCIKCIECKHDACDPLVSACVLCERRLSTLSMSIWRVFDPVASDTTCQWSVCDRCRYLMRQMHVPSLSVTDLSRCRDEVTRQRAKREYEFITGKKSNVKPWRGAR